MRCWSATYNISPQYLCFPPRWPSTSWIRLWSWMKTLSMISHWRLSPGFLPELQLFAASGNLPNLDPPPPQGNTPMQTHQSRGNQRVSRVRSEMSLESSLRTVERAFKKRPRQHEKETSLLEVLVWLSSRRTRGGGGGGCGCFARGLFEETARCRVRSSFLGGECGAHDIIHAACSEWMEQM